MCIIEMHVSLPLLPEESQSPGFIGEVRSRQRTGDEGKGPLLSKVKYPDGTLPINVHST